MNSAHSILSVVLAVLCTASAIGDFLKLPSVMKAAEAVGCPPKLCNILGLIKMLAAVGLIVGLAIDEIGIAAAVGLSIYFVLAVGAHLRVKDKLKGTLPAIVMLAISIASLATSLCVIQSVSLAKHPTLLPVILRKIVKGNVKNSFK